MQNPLDTLTADNLVLRHRGCTVVGGVSLALPSRGAIALIGPNGAGKSSLLSMLAGLQAPSEGAVHWNDTPLQRLPMRERARCIGYMPQRFAPHWDITLAELLHMRLGPAATVDEVLREHGLADFATRRWSTLSGGEQARGLLAAVLATDPPVLLADEPGAALDVRHRLGLVESLALRGRERLVVVVMHDLDLAFAHFDRVIAMHDGRIAQDRPAKDLLADPALDAVFQVHFDRIHAPPGTVLRARRFEADAQRDRGAHAD
ncbi:MAG: ABC transporter ATP-binding protein [Comamonadaceae bacterium]|nr:MAG: ABC transporter ATP-binding protein [Comamonadaceae bacterium]